MLIIKWFNSTLLHIFSCSQPCQTWVVFHDRFLSQEEIFLENFCENLLWEWKNCFVYIQDISAFLRYFWCGDCRERDKIGACPSTCAQGSLVGVGRYKASVFGQSVPSSQSSENGTTSTIFYSQKLTSLYSCPISLHRTFSAPVQENIGT